jgi:hypothetical protein
LRVNAVSVADLFEVSDNDTVWDAWLTTVNLLDMLEHTHRVGQHYNFAQARDKISKIYAIAESHAIDKKVCACGLSDAEHALLKRKVLTFFKLQLSNLKHFLS